MGVQFELRTMVDQALGCPEKGIVNFNMLHNLLHHILNLLGDEKGENNDFRDMVNKDNVRGSNEAVPSLTKIADETQSTMSSSSETLNDFDQRLKALEAKLDVFNSLPATEQFVTGNVAQSKDETASTENALAMMWKFMTLTRRVQATEEGVDKIMDILNGVITDISELKNLRADMESKFREIPGLPEESTRNGAVPVFPENFEKISDFLRNIKSADNIVCKNDLLQFVTWSSLEQALNKREIQDGKENKGTELQPESPRPGTAPVSSATLWDNVDNAPPKTAMPPKEFEKLTGETTEEGNGPKNDDDSAETTEYLPSKENSFDELIGGGKGGQLSRENTQDSHKPSPQLMTQLSRIGELPKQHDDVAVQVSTMSELQSKLASDVHKVEVDILPQKVDKAELNLPENLLDQIEMLKEGLEMLNSNQDLKMLATIKATTVENKENLANLKKELALFSQHLKRIDQSRAKSPETSVPGYDQEMLNSVRDNLSCLQEEQEKTAKKTKEDIARLLDSLDEKQRHIDDLIQYTERLQEGKADRENVATEMDVKADKNALESKVNQSTFEETFEMFDRGLQDALQKMEDYMNEEMSLKDTLARISEEMEGKIDNESLKLMKDYFEKQIKDVQESRNQIARETHVDPSNAAGIRRKLPVHYHCISCDRPVELSIKDSEPTLPGIEGLPLRRLKFPFTSYEVEQLRQKSSKASYNADETPTLRELLAGRPCGGSHTVINSHLRRSTKVHQFAAIAREDIHHVPNMTREVSVLDFLRGSDGNYYKGRTKQVLPSLPKRPIRHTTREQKLLQKGKYLPDESPTEQNKDIFSSSRRTPSPPIDTKSMEELSSSYPEKSFHQRKYGKTYLMPHYSSDDINISSKTFNNRESIKVLQNRRRRNEEKDCKSQRCWGGEPMYSQKDLGDKTDELDGGSCSPKSIKRTTPVGQEETYDTSSSAESSPKEMETREPQGSNGIAEDKSRS